MSEKNTGRYSQRGVSSQKEDVHQAISKIDPGLFQGSFCKITPDHLTGDPQKCNVIHSDGSGTKALLAYLHYKETGDPTVFQGIAQDSIVMNVDDLLCVGATERILLSSTLNRNAKNVPGEVLESLITGTEKALEKLRNYGLEIYSGGGETADVGDLTPTLTVDSCAVSVMDRRSIVKTANLQPGLMIIGLSGAGICAYDQEENSGIGSNGLTSARHDLLEPYYRKKYPETFDQNIPNELVYSGPYRLEDSLPLSTQTVGEALLSPTRSFAPVVLAIKKQYPEVIKAMIHCSGGGQTKCAKFGKGIHFIKNKLLPIPPIFKEIQKASNSSWEEMFEVYNMGHRMELYCKPQDTDNILQVCKNFNLLADIVGYTEPSRLKTKKNQVTLFYQDRPIKYPKLSSQD